MRTIKPFEPMNTQTAGYLVVFGIFLILLGVIGHMTHPGKAHTSLIFGGGFGALWMLWGILSAKGVRWSWLSALATTAVLVLAGAWRGSLGWLAVVNGQAEKVFASIVITLMLAVSVFILCLLLRDRMNRGEEKPAGEAP